MKEQQSSRVLLVLFLGVLMGALDIAIVGPALPAIRSSFAGTGERSLAWIFSAYVLFNLIGTPVMAKLSDMFGRRLIYAIDIGLFAVGSLIVATAPAFSFVLIGRAVQGFGAGGIFPVASAVIGDTFPPERRGSALGLIGAVFGLAFVIGPALAGLILTIGSWHWLFLINVPIALIVMAFGLKLLPGRVKRPVERFDWLGMAALALTLSAFTFALNNIDTAHFGATIVGIRVLPFLISAIVFGFITARIERTAANPILPASLFQSGQLRIGYALTTGAGVGEAAVVFMPLFAIAALSGLKQGQASFLLLPVVLAMAVASPVSGRLLDRFGSKAVIVSGLAVTTIGIFLLSITAGSLTMFIISGALMGFGLSSLLGAPIRYITLNEVAQEDRSAAQGVITVFTSAGQLAGAAVIGAVAASGGGSATSYESAFFVVCAASALMLVAALGLKRRAAERASAQI